jgi:hypothetical protein
MPDSNGCSDTSGELPLRHVELLLILSCLTRRQALPARAACRALRRAFDELALSSGPAHPCGPEVQGGGGGGGIGSAAWAGTFAPRVFVGCSRLSEVLELDPLGAPSGPRQGGVPPWAADGAPHHQHQQDAGPGAVGPWAAVVRRGEWAPPPPRTTTPGEERPTWLTGEGRGGTGLGRTQGPVHSLFPRPAVPSHPKNSPRRPQHTNIPRPGHVPLRR